MSKKDTDKIILLGYKENQEIKFENKNGYYLSREIKYLKKINKISFFIKKKSEQTLSFTIQQNFYGEKKNIYKSDLINLKIGENIIDLNLDIIESFNNSKILIKFGSVNSDKNFIINNVKLYIPNEIDLSNYIILEKYENCYLISNND